MHKCLVIFMTSDFMLINIFVKLEIVRCLEFVILSVSLTVSSFSQNVVDLENFDRP